MREVSDILFTRGGGGRGVGKGDKSVSLLDSTMHRPLFLLIRVAAIMVSSHHKENKDRLCHNHQPFYVV
jgi:hypothetical protein